jgi:hypothetical protein
MKSTRAEFLRLALLAGTAAAAAPRLLARMPESGSAAGPSPADFHDLKDPVFWILGPNGRPKTKLLLEKLEPRDSCAKTRQFSLKFTCPGGARLAENSYPVTHSGLGRFELFLAPAGTAADPKVTYRADFNLLT